MSPVIYEHEFLSYYDKFYKKIFNFILRHVFHRETAEDLTSQTFFKALRHVKKNTPDINNFNAWIYKIATNEILMHHRKKGTKNTFSIEEEQDQLKTVLVEQKSVAPDMYVDFMAVRQELKKLKPQEALVIELYYFEQKSYAEIAEIVNIKETTLRSMIHRSLKKLKERLQVE
ncbi:MAG: sigma-70 family RNA polymerase sigma factor [Spirochaetales bacterium]|nr:sigma-70 family RNA polymerase sigma factor [Spirochaetales bacterium]